MSRVAEIQTRLRELGSLKAAAFAARYFKTGPGEYAEGDRLHGIRVPPLRRLAREYRAIDEKELRVLVRSEIHEERLLALLILVLQMRAGDLSDQERIFKFYLKHTKYINNWDLVDASCREIVGAHLHQRDRSPLDRLARSELIWERRIAIISTGRFISRGEFQDTLRIAAILMEDRHVLIHKAVGWMLREVGKRDQGVLEAFLKTYHRVMPRTMLRYAIERFPEDRRQAYLKGTLED